MIQVTEDQIRRALSLLDQMADNECRFSMSRRGKSPNCGEDAMKDFDCDKCQAAGVGAEEVVSTVNHNAQRLLRAARLLLARGVLAPDVKAVEGLLSASDFEGALKALDELLIRKLHIRALGGDRVHVQTEWAHALDKEELARFHGLVHSLLNVRDALTGRKLVPVDVQHLLNVLSNASDDIVWAEAQMRGPEDEFKHGPFTIVLTTNATDHLEDAIQTLDKAAEKIQNKFPQVLYGRVLIRKDLNGTTAGMYSASRDVIILSLYATPRRNSVQTLVHEFGHRYYDRFLPGEMKARFNELHNVGDVVKRKWNLKDREGFAQEFIDRIKAFSEDEDSGPIVLSDDANDYFRNYDRDDFKEQVVPLIRKFEAGDASAEKDLKEALAQGWYTANLTVVLRRDDYGNDLVHPLYASEYGATDVQENFAECFLAFVMGTDLPDGLQRFMNALP